MIKLVGVLSEGGVPVELINLMESDDDMLIGALVEATKTISSAIGTREVRRLAFQDDTLIVTESEKGYTVIAIADRALDYVEVLLTIIAETIDSAQFPPADGAVSPYHREFVSNIINALLLDKISVSYSELVKSAWSLIQSVILSKDDLRAISEKIERAKADDISQHWFSFASTIEPSRDDAIQYALQGRFDYACAASINLDDNVSKVFAIKMAHLASNMINMIVPPVDLVLSVSSALSGDDLFTSIGRELADVYARKTSRSSYTKLLFDYIDQFEFGEDAASLMHVFIFVDSPIVNHPEFANRLLSFFRNRSVIVAAFLDALIERSALFSKLYSVTTYEEFKSHLGYYKTRINHILSEIESAVGGGFFSRLLRRSDWRELALRASLQFQNYIASLVALSESPVLSLGERKQVLEEVLDLYDNYFRKLLKSKAPLFSYTVDSVFQSMGVAFSEYYHLLPRDLKSTHIEKMIDYLGVVSDVLETHWLGRNWAPSVFVIANAMFPVLLLSETFHENQIRLALLGIKTIDVESIEKLRESGSPAYATHLGNMSTTLTSLLLQLIVRGPRTQVLEHCLKASIDVHRWFLFNGVVCRDDIMSLTLHAAFAANELSPTFLEELSMIVSALNRIAMRDPVKYDYEVAVMAPPLVLFLLTVSKTLDEPYYAEAAKDYHRMAVDAWTKYGFDEVAEDLDKMSDFVGP